MVSTKGIGDDGIGCLKIYVDGTWSVHDFGGLLFCIEEAYSKLSAYMYVSESFEKQLFSSFSMTRAHQETVHGSNLIYTQDPRPDEFEGHIATLLSMARSESSELKIQRIAMSSPGALEIAGGLVALKIICNFVTAWRRENTERQRLVIQSQQAPHLSGDDDGIGENSIPERQKKLREHSNPQFVEAYMSKTLGDAIKLLKGLAKDIQIKELRIGASSDD